MNEGLNVTTRFRVAFGADLREFALLWLVFSLLDVLIKDEMTVRWMAGNLGFTIALWMLGAYIELRVRKEG